MTITVIIYIIIVLLGGEFGEADRKSMRNLVVRLAGRGGGEEEVFEVMSLLCRGGGEEEVYEVVCDCWERRRGPRNVY